MPGSLVSVSSLVPALLAAAIVGTDRRIRLALIAAGANSGDTAIALGAPRILRRWRLRRLVGAGAVGMTKAGDYYLDAEGWRLFRHQRRRRALWAITGVLALAALWLAVTGFGGLTV